MPQGIDPDRFPRRLRPPCPRLPHTADRAPTARTPPPPASPPVPLTRPLLSRLATAARFHLARQPGLPESGRAARAPQAQPLAGSPPSPPAAGMITCLYSTVSPISESGNGTPAV